MRALMAVPSVASMQGMLRKGEQDKAVELQGGLLMYYSIMLISACSAAGHDDLTN